MSDSGGGALSRPLRGELTAGYDGRDELVDPEWFVERERLVVELESVASPSSAFPARTVPGDPRSADVMRQSCWPSARGTSRRRSRPRCPGWTAARARSRILLGCPDLPRSYQVALYPTVLGERPCFAAVVRFWSACDCPIGWLTWTPASSVWVELREGVDDGRDRSGWPESRRISAAAVGAAAVAPACSGACA